MCCRIRGKAQELIFLGTIYLWNVHANSFLQFFGESKIRRFSFSSLTQRTYLKWKKSSIQFSHNLMKFMRNAWYECQIKGNAQHPSTKVILLSRTASFDRESVWNISATRFECLIRGRKVLCAIILRFTLNCFLKMFDNCLRLRSQKGSSNDNFRNGNKTCFCYRQEKQKV